MKCESIRRLFSQTIRVFSITPLFLIACANDENLQNEETSSVVSEIGDNSDFSEVEKIDSIFDSNSIKEEYSYQTIFTENIGWGYQILNYGKVYINQPHIPAIQGNKGFSSEEKASITAEYAISKIKEGIVPPTLSREELEKLDVLN